MRNLTYHHATRAQSRTDITKHPKPPPLSVLSELGISLSYLADSKPNKLLTMNTQSPGPCSRLTSWLLSSSSWSSARAWRWQELTCVAITIDARRLGRVYQSSAVADRVWSVTVTQTVIASDVRQNTLDIYVLLLY